MNRVRERVVLLSACVAYGLLHGHGAAAADPAPVEELRFKRVHVPRDALTDVPLGDERYVPMPRDAFEAAVAGTTRGDPSAVAARAPRADAATYEARVTQSGRLEGRLVLAIAPEGGVDAAGVLPLGALGVTRCTARTAAGVGAAVVFGEPDGTLAVTIPGAGDYVAEWDAGPPRRTSDGLLHILPLVPAVRTSIRLELPPGQRPLLVGHDIPPARDGASWLIEAGLRTDIEFYVVDEESPPPAVAVWSRLGVAGREVAVDASVRPDAVWSDARIVVDKDPALVVTGASLAVADRRAVVWSEAADGRSITCLLPAVALGTRTPLVIHAVGPLPDGAVGPLPALRPPAAQWSGGGAVLEVDSALTLATIELERCIAVTAEAAAAWPLPGAAMDAGADVVAAQVVPARVHLEQQGPGAEVRVAVVPRTARIDVARVTVVDFAPGVVVGVATCDVSVQRGEAFDLTGLVAAGWFIDTVDAVGWSPAPGWVEPASTSDARAAEPLEWKVVRDARGDVLRIGLTAAATPGRRLRLRIGGHRAGAAPGAAFSAGEIDMVRLEGEAEGLAAVGFKTGAEQSVEIVGADAAAVDPRLAPLVDDQAVRGWAAVGGRAAAWQVRLVRRRPPLDVHAQVRLTVRDDRLSQSFTFECRPDASDLDALVVQFSEPMDDQLEWSLLAPASGAMVARRMESADESWVVEFTPPVREAVTIRAARTVPFRAPVAVPLAWVEGAPRQVGEVIVRDAGRRRPRIVNRRLAELPPRSADGDDWPTLIGEFSFAGERDAAAGTAAAELVPGQRDDAAARAWAWRESTSCWCHASGRTEFETVFEIESHGRASVVLGLPVGRQLQGVEIDGVPIAIVSEENVAAVPIELPAGRRSFALVVRSLSETAPRGAWSIEPAGVAIDLPVLDRLCRVALPPELDIASVSPIWRAVGRPAGGVAERLLGAAVTTAERPADGSSAPDRGSPGEAFRVREFVPTDGRGAGGAILIVRRPWLHGAAVVVGIVVAAASLLGARSRPWLPPVFCVVAGVAALWCPAPGDLVARAAWWAAVGAMVLAFRRPVATAGAIALTILCSGAAATAGEVDDLRVFIAPAEDGELALVPEPLYRVLARTGAGDGDAIRVVACRVLVAPSRADPPDGERWRLAIDIDAPAAGVLALAPQEAPDGWVVDSARIDGQAATLRTVAGRHDLLVPAAGRHRVEIDVRPRRELVGDVEMLTAALPPAPLATVELEERAGRDGAGPRGMRCEMAMPDGPFVGAPGAWSAELERFVHDVPRAGRVRVVRPHADGVALAVAPPVVESRNTVAWDLDACRVAASFVVDPGRDVAAPCIVRADRGLARVGAPDPALDVVELPGNRFLVRAARPTGGPLRFELAFRRPLVDPVGVFPVPGAWIEGAAVDVRTTRLVPAGDLTVQVDAPAPLVMLAGDEPGGPGNGAGWRLEVRPQDGLVERGRSDAGPGPWLGREPRAHITVERRRQEIRGTQNVRVRFAPERTGISLDARFDASSTALVAVPIELPAEFVVDSIALFDDGLQDAAAAARGPIETHWRREGPERGVLTVQRPLAGRFRLEMACHLPEPPATTGRVPVVRALLPAAPFVVAWNESLETQSPDRSWELRSDGSPPRYTLRAAVAPEPRETAAIEPPPRVDQQATAEPRVELADVVVTFEDRGRAWGRVRFDVVTDDRLLQLRLPRGMRLFEVFVDGQPTVPATPAQGGAAGAADGGERWDIRLHDSSWPRSIEVVYAGTVGGALDEDGPFALAAPTLVGLPCVRRLWTLRAPRDAIVHVAEPGRAIDTAMLWQTRAAAQGVIDADFARAIAAAAPADRDRLREGFEARAGRRAKAERTAAAAAPNGSVVHVVATPVDAPLTVRISRRRDPTVITRAWATFVLLLVGGAAWGVARRSAPRDGGVTEFGARRRARAMAVAPVSRACRACHRGSAWRPAKPVWLLFGTVR